MLLLWRWNISVVRMCEYDVMWCEIYFKLDVKHLISVKCLLLMCAPWTFFGSFAWFAHWDIPCYSWVGHPFSPHSVLVKGGGLQGSKGVWGGLVGWFVLMMAHCFPGFLISNLPYQPYEITKETQIFWRQQCHSDMKMDGFVTRT